MILTEMKTQERCTSDRVQKRLGEWKEEGRDWRRRCLFTQQKSKKTVIETWICRGVWSQKLDIREEGPIRNFTNYTEQQEQCILVLEVQSMAYHSVLNIFHFLLFMNQFMPLNGSYRYEFTTSV